MKMPANLTVRVRHADGSVTEHRAHNTLTTAGLEHIAQLLTGEATQPLLLNNANNIKLNGTSISALTGAFVGPALAPNGYRWSGTYTPTSEVDWSGQSLTLNIAAMAGNVDLATAAASDFAPPLVTTAANDDLELEWEVTVDWTSHMADNISGGSPYTNTDDAGVAEAFMFNVLRGTATGAFENLTDLVLEVSALSQEPNPSDPQTLEPEDDVTTTTVTRSGAVITLEWDVPSATQVSEGARERVMVPLWKSGAIRVPLMADRVDMPRAASGTTTEVSSTITVSNP